ncbi:Egg cell-secreted protein 1.4 [Striga hermonthica]|uniref:Egg cell-secreted protein 1.4 n=1 Tax=Striga hermonthica TaxID=68872 RepID=A0A9N7RNJ5_STRHE|nr:Egg cell-secreted protein 1.4 [Striga hermonthica]
MDTKSLVFLLTITSLTARLSSYRDFPFPSSNPIGPTRSPEIEGETPDCFAALYKIKSCSNEILNYFATGSIDITRPCCEAITIITHNCWPTVLGMLGYGPDQIYALRGYCDAVAHEERGFEPTSSPFGIGHVLSPYAQPSPADN